MGRLREWWRQRRGRLLQLWGVGLVASLIVSGASSLGYLEGFQIRALDLRSRSRDAPSSSRETRT